MKENEFNVKNIILIIIDALRRDRLKVYGNNIDITPNITKIASRGTIFWNAFSTTNATDPSLTSIWTARYPLSHGIIHHGHHVTDDEVRRIADIPMLQEILQKNGYQTIAIDFLGRWHRRGFDYYGYKEEIRHAIIEFARKKVPKSLRILAKRLLTYVYGSKTKSPFKITAAPFSAKTATRHAIKMLKRVSSSFFMVIHYWDTHTPYNFDEEFIEKVKTYKGGIYDLKIGEVSVELKGPWREILPSMFDPESTLGEVVAMYDASVAYVDSAIGLLIEKLDELGLTDKTLVIITSDHGESLTEHGIYFDHHGLYDVSIRVPLIFYGASIPKGKTVYSFVQHTDLAPTILNMLGIKVEHYMEGRSLIPLLNDETLSKDPYAIRDFIYAEEGHTQRKFAIYDGKYKYIMAPKKEYAICRYCGVIHGGVEELYDLSKDPGEENNIVDTEPDVAKELRSKLKAFIRRLALGGKIREIRRLISR